MGRHKHYFRHWSTTTGPKPIAHFKCRCGEKRERPASQELVANIQNYGRDMHTIYHDFIKRFMRAEKYGEERWKHTGYALMTRVERWAKKYPDDVRIASIDDSVHSGSIMVFIEHRSPDQYMGTTVVVIPQNAGYPCEFFLYPRDRQGVIDALQSIAKQQKANEPAYRAFRRSRHVETWGPRRHAPRATRGPQAHNEQD